MKLIVEIELNNDAFSAANAGVEEVGRILEDVASRLPDPLNITSRGELILHDCNGNWCGRARIVGGKVAGEGQ